MMCYFGKHVLIFLIEMGVKNDSQFFWIIYRFPSLVAYSLMTIGQRETIKYLKIKLRAERYTNKNVKKLKTKNFITVPFNY